MDLSTESLLILFAHPIMAARLTPPATAASDENAAAESSGPAHHESHGSTFRRSPHPYRRRGTSLLYPQATGDEEGQSVSQTNDQWGTTSSSESGTEADDERGRLLKGLPAPPWRPHKGLRNAPPDDLTPQSSPSGTPIPVEGGYGEFSWSRTGKDRNNWVGSGSDVQAIREKYTRRKRMELVRRSTETILFFAIGFVVSSSHLSELWLLNRQSAIASQFGLIILLYLSYPVRVAIQAMQAGCTFAVSFRQGFHLPSRFDVAPLLYPVFLPLLVSIALGPSSSHLLLPNIVLGLSSLPLETISLSRCLPELDPLHWLLTLSPYSFQDAPKPPHLELTTWIFPLHVYTVLTLQFLTTTSLDVAEVRLLGTILVNLYFFARSPQSEILKALLWIGAVLLFIICHKPLQWELALARIPAWRFRERFRRPWPSTSLLQSLDRALCEAFVRLTTGRKATRLEDSEDEQSSQPLSNFPTGTSTFPIAINGLVKQRTTNFLDRSCAPTSASSTRPPKLDFSDRLVSSAKFTPQRRHTLAVAVRTPNERRRTTPNGRPKRSLTPNSQSFLTLGPVQAAVRKAAYAAFTYVAMLFIILGPIRTYIRLCSLRSREPFGWAIGYLFGDIPQFRGWVRAAGWDDWISLPDHSRRTDPDHTGWLEQVRQDDIGSANVRLAISVYCLAILLVGLATVHKLSSSAEVDTRRKVFHGMMVAMLLPTIYIDPCFISLALILILAIFLLLDLIRASQLPPISKPLTTFLAPYVDGRDHRGPVVVSHIFLLVGCAVPLWLSLAAVPRAGHEPWDGWDLDIRDISMVSGVICVGMGDSAASIVGRRYGRHKWYWGGGKSVEGSLAFAAAVTAGLMFAYVWLRLGGWKADADVSPTVALGKAVVAASGASLTESVLTGANDNVVVPISLWLLVRGLAL